MENNETKLADNTSSNGVISVTTREGISISLDSFRDEFEWLRSDFWNLMSRVTQLEDENRKLRDKINDYEYQSMMDRNKVNTLTDIYSECFSNMNKVSEYVGEMSKDYIREYVYANTE